MTVHEDSLKQQPQDTSAESLRASLKGARAALEEACVKEVHAVLAAYGCGIRARMVLNADGTQASAGVEIFALVEV